MKIAAAISGGADSARAAVILREEGHDVFGLHMRLLPGGADDARREELVLRLADRCGIPLTIIDVHEEFEANVIRPFVESYLQGLTPNPCIWCNPRIKFGLLMAEAKKLGAEKLATGHYARLLAPGESRSGRFELRRGTDPQRDQSYFLMGLAPDQLSRAVFPLGRRTKRDTSRWAAEYGLNDLITEDSQEICFIPAGSYTEFIRGRAGGGERSGPIVDADGKVLGRHEGVFSYTIGQRRGLRVPSTEPYYVIRIEPESNTVVVGRSGGLFSGSFIAAGLNWVSIPAPVEPLQCQVRIRNLHNPAPAEVSLTGDGSAMVRFHEPQRAVTPGQAAVFYSDDLLLGGGMIEKVY